MILRATWLSSKVAFFLGGGRPLQHPNLLRNFGVIKDSPYNWDGASDIQISNTHGLAGLYGLGATLTTTLQMSLGVALLQKRKEGFSQEMMMCAKPFSEAKVKEYWAMICNGIIDDISRLDLLRQKKRLASLISKVKEIDSRTEQGMLAEVARYVIAPIVHGLTHSEDHVLECEMSLIRASLSEWEPPGEEQVRDSLDKMFGPSDEDDLRDLLESVQNAAKEGPTA